MPTDERKREKNKFYTDCLCSLARHFDLTVMRLGLDLMWMLREIGSVQKASSTP